MDMAVRPTSRGTARTASYWWSLLAACLAIAVVAASFRMFHVPSPTDQLGSNIAMAPMVATPVSTPAANACTAEPLTADEVMEIVKNPSLRYARLNYDSEAVTPTVSAHASSGYTLEEWPNPSAIKDLSEEAMPRDAKVDIPIAEAKDAADLFWNCLLHGTSYQVWGLIAPELVQMEILRYHQVFRSEEEVMATIQRVGSKPYHANGNKAFSAREAVIGQGIEMRTLPDDKGIWALETDTAQQGRVVIVQMDAVGPDNDLGLPSRHFLLQKFSNGHWIVLGVDWQTVSP